MSEKFLDALIGYAILGIIFLTGIVIMLAAASIVFEWDADKYPRESCIHFDHGEET